MNPRHVKRWTFKIDLNVQSFILVKIIFWLLIRAQTSDQGKIAEMSFVHRNTIISAYNKDWVHSIRQVPNYQIVLVFVLLKFAIRKQFLIDNSWLLFHLFSSVQTNNFYNSYNRAVVVAQLAERLLPIPEDPGSNPVIGNFYWTFVYR